MIPQAVGITAALTRAGLPPAAVHAWFDTPRRELAGLTPHQALTIGGAAAGGRLLELACADAPAFATDPVLPTNDPETPHAQAA